jgi:hypothetical protein
MDNVKIDLWGLKIEMHPLVFLYVFTTIIFLGFLGWMALQ